MQVALRLLRIKRPTDLGFSLTQIAAMGEQDEHPADALRTLDAELAATIERLQRARGDLAVLLRQSGSTDLPPELAPVAAGAGLSEADRSFIVVLTGVLGPNRMQAYADMLRDLPGDPADVEFDALPADADDATREDLAARLAPYVATIRAQHPDISAPHTDAPRSAHFVERTVGTAMRDLYNPAQLDVLQRARLLLDLPPRDDSV